MRVITVFWKSTSGYICINTIIVCRTITLLLLHDKIILGCVSTSRIIYFRKFSIHRDKALIILLLYFCLLHEPTKTSEYLYATCIQTKRHVDWKQNIHTTICFSLRRAQKKNTCYFNKILKYIIIPTYFYSYRLLQ